jgi:hypothetical protein
MVDTARLAVFLSFVPVSDVEELFYKITYNVQSNYPQLMAVINYFENTYLGSVAVDSKERVPPKFGSLQEARLVHGPPYL